jgi:hypothetical protein
MLKGGGSAWKIPEHKNSEKIKMQIVIRLHTKRVVYTCLVGIRIGMEPNPGKKER